VRRINAELSGDVSGVPVLTPTGDRAVADPEDRRDVKRHCDAIHGIHVDSLNDHGVVVRHDRADFAPVDHARGKPVVFFELGARRVASEDHRRQRNVELPEEIVRHERDHRVDVHALTVSAVNKVDDELFVVIFRRNGCHLAIIAR
jgi:hypothetical protein